MILASQIGSYDNNDKSDHLHQQHHLAFAQTQGGSRPGYIYDNAEVLSSEYRTAIDKYVRAVDDSTTAEIVIFTIPSFVGHGIKKDGIEIHDRDALANYIYNELTLDGIKGIGKKGKDNGVLVLLSLQPDAGGGSMRIEVGRGLEGNITDGTAGAILDAYLVPAMNNYRSNGGDKSVFDRALLNTVLDIGSKIGYTSSSPLSTRSETGQQQQQPFANPGQSNRDDNNNNYRWVFMVMMFLAFGILPMLFRGRRRRGFYYGGGGYGGGGFGGGGGGGSSGGGGAGR